MIADLQVLAEDIMGTASASLASTLSESLAPLALGGKMQTSSMTLQEAKDADLEETLARLKAFEVGDD